MLPQAEKVVDSEVPLENSDSEVPLENSDEEFPFENSDEEVPLENPDEEDEPTELRIFPEIEEELGMEVLPELPEIIDGDQLFYEETPSEADEDNSFNNNNNDQVVVASDAYSWKIDHSTGDHKLKGEYFMN